MPNYFLCKTDPETYSIDDLAKAKKTTWDGVKNPTARIIIKSMQPGDICFLYHSQGDACIVGLMKVTSVARDDVKEPNRSSVMDVEYIATFEPEEFITLKEVKESGDFDDWTLVRIGRLSVHKVPESFLKWPKVAKVLKKYL